MNAVASPRKLETVFGNTRRRFKVVERTLCAQVDAGFPNALVGVKDVFE